MSNMQDILNTYEGAKPSRAHRGPLGNERDITLSPSSYFFASRIYDTGERANGTESWYEGSSSGAFCGPGTQRACFWVIFASRWVGRANYKIQEIHIFFKIKGSNCYDTHRAHSSRLQLILGSEGIDKRLRRRSLVLKVRRLNPSTTWLKTPTSLLISWFSYTRLHKVCNCNASGALLENAFNWFKSQKFLGKSLYKK